MQNDYEKEYSTVEMEIRMGKTALNSSAQMFHFVPLCLGHTQIRIRKSVFIVFKSRQMQHAF